MKKIVCLIAVVCLLSSCSTDTHFLKNEQDFEKWKNEQDLMFLNEIKLYSKHKKKIQKNVNKIIKSIKWFKSGKSIKGYHFKIKKNAIFYKKIKSKDTLQIFALFDSIHNTPVSFIENNYSNYLILKKSKFSNDDYNVQIWDIEQKKLIKQIKALNFPKIQSTKNNLYYFQYEKEKYYKKTLYSYNYKEDKINKTQGFKWQMLALSEDKFLNYSSKEYQLIEEIHKKDVKTTIILQEKNQKPVGINKTHIYTYKEFNDKVVFYKCNLKNTHLKKIFTIGEKIVVNQLILVKEKLVISVIKKGINYLYLVDLEKRSIKRLNIPKYGTINLIKKDSVTVGVNFSSFTVPKLEYEYYSKSSVLKKTNASLLKNDSSYVVHQKWVIKEEDSIPLLLFYKKNLKINKNSSLILYGYGGFNISSLPSYNPFIQNFVDNGGVYCIAGIKGGGEMGKEWHLKGKGLFKKESFNDFRRCLDYLIDNSYSNPNKIAIMGYSNGGLLINNAVLNYSDRFNTAVSVNSLSDISNLHKYNNRGYSPEYNSSNRVFSYFYKKSYSPLQHIKKINTNFLIVCGDKDDRVSPLHSYKFVKDLQNKKSQNTFLYRIKDTGHGTLSSKRYFETQSNIFSFLFYNLSVPLN